MRLKTQGRRYLDEVKDPYKRKDEGWLRRSTILRLCGPNASGSGLVFIVRWWAILIVSLRSCPSRSRWPLRRLCRIHLRRRSRPRRWLSYIRVHIRVGNVSRAHLAIWDGVVSVPRPSECVRTLRSLSSSLRVRILVRVISAVRVNQILVTPRGIWIAVWVWLLLLDRRRMGWNGGRRVVGCGRVNVIRIIRSALLMGRSGMIYARAFRTGGQQVTEGCTHKMIHEAGVRTERRQLQGIGSWIGGE